MKKQALIIALLAAAGFASTSAFAADGTITFTGEIKGQTCTIGGGSGTTPGTGGNFAVTLPTVQTTALAAAGATAGAKPFSIQLGSGAGATCPVGTKAAIVYEPSSSLISPTTGNLLNNAATAPATNVEVQILDGGTPMDLRTGTASTEVTVGANNTAILPFSAQYVATGAAAGAGAVSTSVQYSVTFP